MSPFLAGIISWWQVCQPWCHTRSTTAALWHPMFHLERNLDGLVHRSCSKRIYTWCVDIIGHLFWFVPAGFENIYEYLRAFTSTLDHPRLCNSRFGFVRIQGLAAQHKQKYETICVFTGMLRTMWVWNSRRIQMLFDICTGGLRLLAVWSRDRQAGFKLTSLWWWAAVIYFQWNLLSSTQS